VAREIEMTGMENREFVLDTIEDEELDNLGEADVNEAIGLLNTGVHRSLVRAFLEGWNIDKAHEAECETLAAADFEERAYGRD
jgi:hypothetical protein